jgi:hypothetical protein
MSHFITRLITKVALCLLWVIAVFDWHIEIWPKGSPQLTPGQSLYVLVNLVVLLSFGSWFICKHIVGPPPR